MREFVFIAPKRRERFIRSFEVTFTGMRSFRETQEVGAMAPFSIVFVI